MSVQSIESTLVTRFVTADSYVQYMNIKTNEGCKMRENSH